MMALKEQHRFVLLSDLHSHPWSAFAKGDGLHNSRLRRSLNILEASLIKAEEELIPWVFAGDLVHTAGYALNTVMAGITEILVRHADCDKIVVWGNHDARGVGGKITADQTVFAALACAVPMLTILDPSVTQLVTAGGITFSGAGYQPRIALLDDVGRSDVGIYHQTVRGSLAPNNFMFEEGLDPELLLDRHRFIIVGHVHHPQQIWAPDGQGILIPGSPEHHNFGDREEHGWWIVTLEDESDPELEFIAGGSPEFRTVETPADVKPDGNFYRVRTMPAGSRLPDGVLAVAPMPTTIEHRDILQGVSEVDQILEVWLKTQPPDLEVFDAQAWKEYLGVGRELLTAQDPVTLRNTQLAALHLTNFCCFEDQLIRMQPGIHLVTGIGRDYPSNGAGKSSLVGEALYWLLFGRTTKGQSADEVIHWGQKECSVHATFTEGDKITLLATRRRGPEGHTLTVAQDGDEWEATSVNEMTTKLGHYLGITPEIFQNLAYFSQEKLLLFSSATDGERKNVLADLIGLRAYQDASTEAGVKVIHHETERMRWVTRAEAFEEQLAKSQADIKLAETELAEWEVTHQQAITAAVLVIEKSDAELKGVVNENANHLADLITKTKKLIAEFKAAQAATRADEEEAAINEAMAEQAEKLHTLKESVHKLLLDAASGFSSLTTAKKAVARLPEQQQALIILEENHAALSKERLVLNDKRAEGRTTCAQLVTALTEAAAQIDKAQESLEAGVCPTCQQPITKEHRDRCILPLCKRMDDLRTEHQAAVEQLTFIKTTYEKAEHQFETTASDIRERRVVLARLGKADAQLQEAAGLDQRIKDLQETTVPTHLIVARVDAQNKEALQNFTHEQDQHIATLKQTAREAAETHTRQLTQLKGTLTLVQQETNPGDVWLQKTMNLVATLHKQLEEEQVQITDVEKTIALYDYWRTGFSKQGLQSLLVEEIAVRFNANRADIFPLLTQGIYDVQFSTLSKTRAGELRERTEFLVYERGELMPYAALSGGQRRRIDIGIMLVITQAVAEWMGTKGVLGLLILDEVFGFLDASGAEGLLAALSQISTQVPTIYVITHDTHLQSIIPSVIQVVQDSNGNSKVV